MMKSELQFDENLFVSCYISSSAGLKADGNNIASLHFFFYLEEEN